MTNESKLDLLAHNEGDDVAVAVRDIEPGTRTLAYLDTERRTTIEVSEPVRLGHKVALNDLSAEHTLIEYGEKIGLTKAEVKAGALVHTHNLRSARW